MRFKLIKDSANGGFYLKRVESTFPEFQQYLARYGFTYTPITSDQYAFLVDSGHDVDSCYGIACDVAAGYEFSDLI